MPRIRLPHRRRYRVLLALAGLFALYLVALSLIPALFGGESAADRRDRALMAIQADNWGLVLPEERTMLGKAMDDAWRSLRSYQMRYFTGLPGDLAAGQFETEAGSAFRLDSKGYITAQRDTSFVSAASPASGGSDERLEGFRILTNQPYVNAKGRRVANTELVYQRSVPGVWMCERVASDRTPPPAPGLDFNPAGDAGFREIDGHRVRGFVLDAGAFGLRSPATVWIDTETLRIRRQETDSVLRGRREVWTYTAFDEPVEIQPPTGVTCQES